MMDDFFNHITAEEKRIVNEIKNYALSLCPKLVIRTRINMCCFEYNHVIVFYISKDVVSLVFKFQDPLNKNNTYKIRLLRTTVSKVKSFLIKSIPCYYNNIVWNIRPEIKPNNQNNTYNKPLPQTHSTTNFKDKLSNSQIDFLESISSFANDHNKKISISYTKDKAIISSNNDNEKASLIASLNSEKQLIIYIYDNENKTNFQYTVVEENKEMIKNEFYRLSKMEGRAENPITNEHTERITTKRPSYPITQKNLKDKIVIDENVKNENITISSEELEEEKEHLRQVRQLINNVINKPLTFKGVHTYSVGNDYDDVEDLNYKKMSNQISQDMKKPYILAYSSPYSMRVDLENSMFELSTYYFGFSDLFFDDPDYNILSYYSDLGMLMQNKGIVSFKYNGEEYKVLLIRKFEINNGCIAICMDTYRRGITPNNITDPFLLSVLRYRRNEPEMHSILSTIQNNQMNIVSCPQSKNIIVQGCAGSGKTVIIFQRLAKIAYDSKEFKNRKVRVITPNHWFSDYITPFAKQLGLDSIEPITPIGYFEELLKRRNVESFNEVRLDDEIANNKFVEDIYSESFLELVGEKYNAYLNKRKENIQLNRILECGKDFGVTYQEESGKAYEFNNFINSFKSQFEKNEVTIKQTIEDFKSLIEPYKQIEKNNLKESIDAFDQQTNDDIVAFIDECNEHLNTRENSLSGIISFLEKNYREGIDNKKTSLDLLQKELQGVLEDKRTHDEREKWINTERPKLIEELETLKNKRYLFSFSRKKLEDKQRIDEIQSIIKAKDDSSSSFGSFGLEWIEERIPLLERNIQDFEKGINESENYLKDYSNRATSLQLTKQAIEEIKEKYSTYSNYITTSNFYYFIIKADSAALIQYDDLYNNCMIPAIKEMCEKYQINYSEKTDSINRHHYEFQLYVKALCLNIYALPILGDEMICIDEAQEFNANQISLINELNNNPVINLYGDLNQRSSAKGLRTWDDLGQLLNATRFELKENYRNPKGIVEFYNKELGANDMPIGKQEPDDYVNVIGLNECLDYIDANYSDKSLCIIASKESSIYEQLQNKYQLFNGDINKKKPFIMSVSQTKGMEFLDVLVVDDGLTKTEEYIAYSRSRSKLTVAKHKA